MSDNTVFIVEDEEKIAQLLSEYLQHEGFKTQILLEGTYAVETILKADPTFVILDLMLPGKDGLEICKSIRQSSNVPILMLTARVDEIDRLLGLEMGADDYVCKPFLPREIVARVRAILRRFQLSTAPKNSDTLEHRGISLSTERFQCEVLGQDIELTPVEFRMLNTMMSQPGRVFTREQLMKNGYLDDRIVSDRTIDSHIKNLRKKILSAMADTEVIHSIYGVGYKFE